MWYNLGEVNLMKFYVETHWKWNFTWKFIGQLDKFLNEKKGDGVTEKKHNANNTEDLIKNVTFWRAK